VGALALLGASAFAGIALLIAARATKPEVASGWMNFVQMPMWLLSGAFFSYERFPEALHPLLRLLPLTALNDALRAVINEGAGIADLASPGLVLLAWGLVPFAIALRAFRWQ
jgi:ABC-type multidrug transport system permease subunit